MLLVVSPVYQCKNHTITYTNPGLAIGFAPRPLKSVSFTDTTLTIYETHILHILVTHVAHSIPHVVVWDDRRSVVSELVPGKDEHDLAPLAADGRGMVVAIIPGLYRFS